MALDREIEAVRKDPDRFRFMAKQLLEHDEASLTDQALDFLEKVSGWKWSEDLSYRQAEWLLDLRDDHQMVTAFRGYSIGALVRVCFLNRFEFDEDAQEWIEGVHASGRTSLRRREAARLHRLARRLGEAGD